MSVVSVRGAREHNLKNIDIDIPYHKTTVITGLSGSGKSSLAFDTIYAEGQRRYIESLSAYARNFLEQLKKPEVDSVSGLCPSLSIDQKTNSSSPRSTVGTVTEIYDYLRLLFAKVGTPHCPEHKIPVQKRTLEQIFEQTLEIKEETKFLLLAPVVQDQKGEFLKEFEKWAKMGFVRAKVDGKFIELANAKKLAKTKRHDIDIVVDRLVMKESLHSRIKESLNTALQLTKGNVVIELLDGTRKNYSMNSTCAECGFNFPKIDHRFFSFNNPRGACSECNGLGYIQYEYEYESEEEEDDTTYYELSNETCTVCNGLRLKEEVRSVFINGYNIVDFSQLAAQNLIKKIDELKFNSREKIISEKILAQIKSRLNYLERVGVGYLHLSRPTRTLSGGEAQRIRLATQLGSALIGVLYVLDEPSIGLHPQDHHRMLEVINELKNLGNTIIMVEHDEDTIRTADFVIDLGPRAGVHGGDIIAKGTPQQIAKNEKSLTGQYLSGKKDIGKNFRKKAPKEKVISLTGATGNNLKNASVDFPLENFITVTGVSGSGKSTLIIDTLYRALSNQIYSTEYKTAPFEEISGIENLDKVIEINQRPIGRTPRSNPATYVGLLPLIRNLFAQHPESRMRGYKPGRFSFNVKGGRCENCQGAGMVKVEMHFLSNVFVPCDVCNGKRYNYETLNIRYKDKNIADVLDMTVAEALDFFQNHKHIHKKLETLHQVGLDYITLGQSSTTLSGGEAQRVKLSKELSRRSTGKTFYILDEPTTGLHFDDVAKLIELLQALVEQKNTVLVIEHNLDVIRSADHVVDLGPLGGDAGGEVLAVGSPEEVSKNKKSVTGQFLKRYFTSNS